MGFKKTARTTKEFPTVATIEISVEQTAVENDKYIGTVVLPQEYLPRKDIFSTSSSGFVAPTRKNEVSEIHTCPRIKTAPLGLNPLYYIASGLMY